MVTATRRERQRREVREGILNAAREIAARDGWQAVTIRRLAERIEYSPPVIYEHFDSKEAVLVELVRLGFGQLEAALEAARGTDHDPAVALQRMAAAYWAFAWDAPDLYQAMYGLGGVPFGVAATWTEGSRIGEVTASVVAAISGSSGPPEHGTDHDAGDGAVVGAPRPGRPGDGRPDRRRLRRGITPGRPGRRRCSHRLVGVTPAATRWRAQMINLTKFAFGSTFDEVNERNPHD